MRILAATLTIIVFILFAGCSSSKNQKSSVDASQIIDQDSVSTPHDSTPTTDEAVQSDDDALDTKDESLSDEVIEDDFYVPGC